MSVLESLTLHQYDGYDTRACNAVLNNMVMNPKSSKSLKKFAYRYSYISPQPMADFLSSQSLLTHVCLKRQIGPWRTSKPQEISKVVCAVRDAPLLKY